MTSSFRSMELPDVVRLQLGSPTICFRVGGGQTVPADPKHPSPRGDACALPLDHVLLADRGPVGEGALIYTGPDQRGAKALREPQEQECGSSARSTYRPGIVETPCARDPQVISNSGCA